MADLTALTPCAGLLPVTVGDLSLREVTPRPITWLAPYAGQWDEVSAALQDEIGAGLPGPNATTSAGEIRVQWTGPGQVLVIGAVVAPEGAAVADQSDAWAVIEIAGPGVEAVLARLVPLDLRTPVFGVGATARTMLAHMTCAITRTGSEVFEIMVFRSMATTAVHDLERAMTSVAAQG